MPGKKGKNAKSDKTNVDKKNKKEEKEVIGNNTSSIIVLFALSVGIVLAVLMSA